MKRIISIVLAAILSLSIMQVSVFAATPTVVFDVGKSDANGIFIISVTIKDAKYAGFTFALNYDKTVITPVKFKDGTATTYYTEIVNYPTVAKSTDGKEIKDWFTEIDTKLDVENGSLRSAHCTNLYAERPNSIVGEYNLINATNPLLVYQYKFKKLKDGDAKLKITDFSLSDGSVNQIKNPVAIITIPKEVKHGTGTVIEPVSSGGGGVTMTQKKAARDKDTVVLKINSPNAIKGGVLINVDSQNVKVAPYIKNSRTMVPVRFLTECLGYDVKWDAVKHQVTVTANDKVIVLTIKKDTYTINGEVKTLDAPAEILEGRTFAPIRLITEAFGKEVYWNSTLKYVIMTPFGNPWDEKFEVESALINDYNLLFSPFISQIVK